MGEEVTFPDGILSLLEDKTRIIEDRIRNYKLFLELLKFETKVEDTTVERLLSICIHDIPCTSVYHTVILDLIVCILTKIKNGFSPTPANLFSIATAVLKHSTTLDTHTLCFEILVLLPDHILIEIVSSNSTDLVDVFKFYCHKKVSAELRILPCELICKLFEVLPKELKIDFLQQNLLLCFSKLIPTLIHDIENIESTNLQPLITLEAMTKELIDIDYQSDDTYWTNILECICNAQKYPCLMKKMLENGNQNWHRLWIVCIKLLKNQITRNHNPNGSPINSMLPVVEAAFKMDIANRCRAFQCWKVLIDNFHTETNEVYIVKRLKLLIIPLRSNNAKVEDTALAKLDTWWHLIRRFEPKIEKFIDSILISFLHFCFGKQTMQKLGIVPGLLTENVKKNVVLTFNEIAGHLNCPGCVDIPKLNGKIITNKILVDFWKDWIHSLKVCISILSENLDFTSNQTTCAFKSFALIISELPDNSVRRDLFDELLSILGDLLQDFESDTKAIGVVILLTLSLFENVKLKPLLRTKKGEQGPMRYIISLLLQPIFISYYRGLKTKDVISTLKKVTNYIFDKTVCSSEEILKWMLSDNISDNNIAFLWTALAENIYEGKYKELSYIKPVLFWAIKPTVKFSDVKYSSYVWYKLFQYVCPMLSGQEIEHISNFLWSHEIFQTSLTLKLYAIVLMFIRGLIPDHDYYKYVELLLGITDSFDKYRDLEDITPLLVHTFKILMKNENCFTKVKCTKHTLRCIKNVMKFMIDDIIAGKNYSSVLDELLIHLNIFLLKKTVQCYITIIADEISNLTLTLKNCPTLKNSVLALLKTCFTCVNDENIRKGIKISIESIEANYSDKNAVTQFSTPDTKIKKLKKKEADIINKVVENGEEFVVVKSNWKFNPRKLTENQKEKLLRKREDIPALYQDLSQSQDEFKLTAWKTESQDSFSTSSKSITTSKSTDINEAPSILKNIPSSNVIPKIIENIFHEKTKKENSETEALKISNINLSDGSIKDAKSPQLALKDRVFRNVRNLMEKSNIQNIDNNQLDCFSYVENNAKTPTSKYVQTIKVANSAPPNISTDRPSRVKRKPKKFDDTEIFALKRGRHSLSQDMQNEFDSQCADSPDFQNQDDDISNVISCAAEPYENVVSEQSETSKTSKNNDSDLAENINDMLTEAEYESNINNAHNGKDQIQLVNKNQVMVTSENNVSAEMTQLKELCVTNDGKEVSNNIIRDELPTSIESNEKKMLNLDEALAGDNVKIRSSIVNCAISTPNSNKKQLSTNPRSNTKKTSAKKSLIEKKLAIDTVEGHPLLSQTERRVTRKTLNSSRRLNLTEKLNKSKTESKANTKTPLMKKKSQITKCTERKSTSVNNIKDKTPEKLTGLDDLPLSEDVIESSQDSTFTPISVSSAKKPIKKLAVMVEKVSLNALRVSNITKVKETNIEDKGKPEVSSDYNGPDSKDDTILPQNKTVLVDRSELDQTDNMDTEPLSSKIIDDNSNDVMIFDDKNLEELPVIMNSETICVGSETQEIAEADTQPTDPNGFDESINDDSPDVNKQLSNKGQISTIPIQYKNTDLNSEDGIVPSHQKNKPILCEDVNSVSSPFKDDEQRQKDFLDNTLEISPIKTMSPVRDKKSPSPETINDFVVIKLSSPVQSNGEPYDKCDSPEIFTEDKVSPDKRENSPSGDETSSSNPSSPRSSLSLKKNRPQVRSTGRAAQMLGLCVPNRLQTITPVEINETDDSKKTSLTCTPVRRNLRILYNSVGDSNESSEENDNNENFLKFKRSLPTTDCSPSGPILKRKLVEINDDTTISPASKRKRVSFHDPPVSTTIAVQKYIEPCGVRSPQNSALKRSERQHIRSQLSVTKSPKRLDNVFKLDTVLTKAIESFTDIDFTATNYTQSLSLDETPAVEIIKCSELNNVDPIYGDLIDCHDPIDNIAGGLTSASMQTMFLKELDENIKTVGDLAKMTELQVNRLCIKAPKIKVAKRVLEDYAIMKLKKKSDAETVIQSIEIDGDEVNEEILNKNKVDVVMKDAEVETIQTILTPASVQTDKMMTNHQYIQTNDTGSKSTKNIVQSCIIERPDFIDALQENLDVTLKQEFAEKIPLELLTEAFMRNVTSDNSKSLITQMFDRQNLSLSEELSYIEDYLVDRFPNKDLILFCSRLLGKVHKNL